MGADGVPDVVFVTYRQNDFPGTNGVLRIVSGVDGTELVTVTDPDLRLASFGQIAVGDIDLDGLPEILARDDGQGLLMAFEHDGTHKWTGPDVDLLSSGQWGGPSIVNLDADPEPEIVFGRAAFDNTGALMWRGTGGRGTIKGPLSLIADIDQTFPPEIIAGNTIYNADGTIRYQNLTLSDGLNAIGNFDADPEPEIVHVANGEIHLLEHDLSVIWGPVVFPVTPINGGIPIVGDFDGDGAPEHRCFRAGAFLRVRFRRHAAVGCVHPGKQSRKRGLGIRLRRRRRSRGPVCRCGQSPHPRRGACVIDCCTHKGKAL